MNTIKPTIPTRNALFAPAVTLLLAVTPLLMVGCDGSTNSQTLGEVSTSLRVSHGAGIGLPETDEVVSSLAKAQSALRDLDESPAKKLFEAQIATTQGSLKAREAYDLLSQLRAKRASLAVLADHEQAASAKANAFASYSGEAEIAALQSTRADLNAQLETLADEVAALDDQRESVLQDAEVLREQAGAYREAQAGLRSQIVSVSPDHRVQIAQHIQELGRQASAQEREYAELIVVVDRLTNTQSDTQAQLQVAQAQRDAVGQALAQERERAAFAANQRDAFRQQAAQLQAEFARQFEEAASLAGGEVADAIRAACSDWSSAAGKAGQARSGDLRDASTGVAGRAQLACAELRIAFGATMQNLVEVGERAGGVSLGQVEEQAEGQFTEAASLLNRAASSFRDRQDELEARAESLLSN